MTNYPEQHTMEKLIHMLHSITKLDLRYVDATGVTRYEFIHHTIPMLLLPPNLEAPFIHNVIRRYGPGHCYHHINPYGLEYLATGLWSVDAMYGYILIGPFISRQIIVELIQQLMVNKQIKIGDRRALEQYYESLSILSTHERQYLGQLLGHLGVHHDIRVQLITDTEEALHHPPVIDDTIDDSKQIIEQRYEHQNQLMDAISAGDIDKLTVHVDYLISELVAFSDRVPGSPIRSSKNIGFVLNTMCRIAAERSGVHPLYLHTISERFAIMIERATSIPQLKQLYTTIPEEYCELVATVATSKYSMIIKKVVDYIYLNLGTPLLLHDIAEHVHVNPSHLSRKFKEETGMTITDFINQKRIDEAKLHLRRGNLTITEVAFMVGFNDLNYFGKVFKKFTSETPSQYAKKRK